MLCATPLGLFDGGYESIILPTCNPYGVLREKASYSALVVRLGGLVFKKESAAPYLLALRTILLCLFKFSGH